MVRELRKGGAKRATVIVLGDFGRSPRMQYHALSLAKQGGFLVDVLAFGGSQPINEIVNNDRIKVHTLPDRSGGLQQRRGALQKVLKALLQLCTLLRMLLFTLPSPDVLLLQVPPALPTLPVCWLAACWHGAAFIVDWHNFAYTLMALNMGQQDFLVRMAERLERFWGRRAAAHLCVSHAMQRELASGWGIQATVFHDRPPSMFRPTPIAEAHLLWLRLTPALAKPMQPHDFCAAALRPVVNLMGGDQAAAGLSAEIVAETRGVDAQRLLPELDPKTGPLHTPDSHPRGTPEQQAAHRIAQHLSICTRMAAAGSAPELRADRPAVVVSSTSWTPDEDFGILLEAAKLYDARARRKGSKLPALLLIVTGKGPQKAMYQAAMEELDLRHVAFRTLWLEPEDYPVLLGACDAGVSLHTSSSGLDLPMKVVDMFGSGLPVCAASYSCIDELVSEYRNGLLFTTAEQLADCLESMLTGFPAGSTQLARLPTTQVSHSPDFFTKQHAPNLPYTCL
ncbi:hypothetical protein WJX73_008651 [Symbiochloris irregularis]|uniref:Beta-1,4-mannosyltransferase n=1 Tax=Symbiochloris irregularis TaxID=706552 RepID=A0AAW1PMN3_9CHLO